MPSFMIVCPGRMGEPAKNSTLRPARRSVPPAANRLGETQKYIFGRRGPQEPVYGSPCLPARAHDNKPVEADLGQRIFIRLPNATSHGSRRGVTTPVSDRRLLP